MHLKIFPALRAFHCVGALFSWKPDRLVTGWTGAVDMCLAVGPAPFCQCDFCLEPVIELLDIVAFPPAAVDVFGKYPENHVGKDCQHDDVDDGGTDKDIYNPKDDVKDKQVFTKEVEAVPPLHEAVEFIAKSHGGLLSHSDMSMIHLKNDDSVNKIGI